jgi:MFS family permease
MGARVAEEGGYEFKPHEQPSMPGSPHTPDHPLRRRVSYVLIGVLIGLTGGLGNALVTVNLNFAQGTLGLAPDEAAWLTAAYLMTSATANLLLMKFRQQYGLRAFIRGMLALHAMTTVLHLLVHGFWSSVLVRAASGASAAVLSTLTLLYIIQGMPAARRLAGIMLGISIPQLATPIARMLSPHLLETGDWHMLYWFELGLVLATQAAIWALPLPPSQRVRVFERSDFLTFALLAPGLWLLIAVLTEGRIEWWTERPWIGIALALSLVLLTAGLVFEHFRANPLVNTRFLGTREMARLIAVAATVRILLSEQAFGSVGLLTVLGMTNDQMVGLNAVIVVASVAGMLTGVLTFNPQNLSRPITIAVAMIAVAAFMDAGATNLTRPSSFMLSQALVGFASMLFLGQAMVIGMARTLLAGPSNFISFAVLFSLSQSLGGLAGSALLGTFQTIREKVHSHELVQQVMLADPQVAARVRSGAGALAGTMGDPVLRNAEGVVLLSRAATREAQVLAYNDVFLLIGILSLMAVAWGLSIRRAIVRRGEESPVVLLQRQAQQRAAAIAVQETR